MVYLILYTYDIYIYTSQTAQRSCCNGDWWWTKGQTPSRERKCRGVGNEHICIHFIHFFDVILM
jgi:hypothetical protein